MSRYPAMFDVLKERGEGAFVPFVMVGDPDPTTSEAVIEALIAGGADALELGVPFTDPVADGAISGSATVKIVERYAPEIVAATSEEHGGPGSEERRHYALGALRSELVAFTAAMKEATRRY